MEAFTVGSNDQGDAGRPTFSHTNLPGRCCAVFLFNAILAQETFAGLIKTELKVPVQNIIAIFGEFFLEAEKLWKALKKVIPGSTKDLNDNSSVLKVVSTVCQTYLQHLPAYFFYLQKLKEKAYTFEVVMKNILQTWWIQHKSTEGEAIKTTLQVETIHLVADNFNIVINALQFAPRRQLFIKQLLQAYAKNTTNKPNKTVNLSTDNNTTTNNKTKKDKKKGNRVLKRDKWTKTEKIWKTEKADNVWEVVGQIKSTLRLIIEGNSKL